MLPPSSARRNGSAARSAASGRSSYAPETKSGRRLEFLDYVPLTAEQEHPLGRLAVRGVAKGPGDLVPKILPERVPVAGAGDPAAIGLLDIGKRQLAAHVPGSGGQVELERFTVLGDRDAQPSVLAARVGEARVAGGQPIGTEGGETVGGKLGRDAAEVALVLSRPLRGTDHELVSDPVRVFEIGIRHRGLRDGRRARGGQGIRVGAPVRPFRPHLLAGDLLDLGRLGFVSLGRLRIVVRGPARRCP